MEYKHIFGPVPSRRLGVSLGVDLVTHKICSLDCIYCECGKTTRLTGERKAYVSTADVKRELDHYLARHPAPDYITFSGSGEPTLNSGLGEVIRYIKEKNPAIRVAVLTNATLFSDPNVREELAAADLVVPSLDAALQNAFEEINQPRKGIEVKDIIEGILAFSKIYSGIIWLEILILPDINDAAPELEALKGAVHQIQPDMVQLNTLDRPGTCADITPATKIELEKVREFLSYPSVEIIAKVDKNISAGLKRRDLAAAIIETVHRRPCTRKDLLQILGEDEVRVAACITRLVSQGKISETTRDRGVFYQTVKSDGQ